MSSHDGSASIRLALASAAIISPFQSASTLSSRPGRTRAFARGEKFCAQRGKPRFVLVAARQRLEPIENVVAFEIACRRHVVVAGEKLAVLDAELPDHLVIGPDVEFALLAFGIGIERSGERALARRHFALEPGDGLVRALAVERLAGAQISDRQQFEELRIVVEHFLEMRHEPALVDRIAGKAAAEMIVDAAFADVVERDLDGGEIARLAGAQAGAPEQLEQSRLAGISARRACRR